MLFGIGKKNDRNSTLSDSGTFVSDQNITDNLYKQNIKIASQNKNLSILRKLYEITIDNLEPEESVKLMTQAIQEEMSFEVVGILSWIEKQNLFKPLGFSTSTRISVICSDEKLNFNDLTILHNNDNSITKSIVKNKKQFVDSSIENIWGSKIKQSQYKKIAQSNYIKTSILSPLIADGKLIGISIFSLNRNYSDLDEYDKEIIDNINKVISISIDRLIIYDKLIETNSELETANDRLQELDQQKSEFVSLASHQLRGPLTAIKGYISLILEGDYGKVPKNIEGALKKVQSSTSDLAILVGDYLDVSRIELGHMKYNFSSFSLNDLLEEIIGEMRPTVTKKGLELEIKLDKLPANVHADKNKIKQVLLNLLDNAVKYTPEGKISLLLDRVDHSVIISVKDSGVGISKNVLPNLFQKFSRAPNASKTNIIGTGLGLYVAKQIMDEHRGEIWANSEGEDKGSTFYIKLPLV